MSKSTATLIAFLALGSLACFSRKQYRVRNTPDGAACARQCQQTRLLCLNGTNRNGMAQLGCAKEEDSCRSTCPGAEAMAEN